MAINPQNKKDAEEIRELVQDTLISISKSMSEAIRTSVEEAVDGVDAKIKDTLGKDLARSMTNLAKASKDSANNLYKIREGLLSSKDISKQLTAIDERRLTLAREVRLAKRNGLEIDEEQLGAVNQVLKEEKAVLLIEQQKVQQIEKQIGLTGKLISSISKIPGIGQFIKADEIDQEMRKAAAQGAGRFKTMSVAAKMVGKQLFDGLTDPLAIIGKIFDTYLDINKASVDLQRLTGQNAVAAASWNTSYASAKDILETMAELTKQTGMNAQNVFSSKVLSQAAELKTTMGLTAEEAGGIAMMAQTSNKAVQDITESVVATTSAFNKANRSAVSQGQVLRDVANTADSIKLSLGNNDVAIAKAASAARRLGMDLARVDQIAGSLMNFEDSIGKELEAELLTGKQLNLEKARELALSNDLAGLSEELFKNSSDIAEFGKMNRIQQESYAAALGMTKDELAKIAYQKGLELNMTEEQAAAAAGVQAEDMKRIAAQENFAKALEKIAGALAPILDLVGDILSMPLVPYLILGVAAVAKIGGGLIGTVKSMGSLAKSTLDFVKNLNMKGISDFFGGLKGKFGELKGAFGEGLAGKVQEKVADTGGSITEKLSDKAQDAVAGKAEELGDKVGGAADKTKGLNKGAGAGIKGFFQALGQGFRAFALAMATPTPLGPVGLVMAVSLGVITGAIIGLGYALGLAAPGIEAFGTVVTAAFGGIATLIGAVADGFVKIIGAVSMDNIGPMLLLGPALFGIAAGLGAVALAGLTAIPAIGGLVLLSKAAPGLVSLGMGGENKSAGEAKKEGEKSSLETKLGALITAIEKGHIVNVSIDGSKIATANIKYAGQSAGVLG